MFSFLLPYQPEPPRQRTRMSMADQRSSQRGRVLAPLVVKYTESETTYE
jgi:hypothetical protein